MKKRVISYLLILSVLLSLMVAPVSAAVENVTAVTDACPCGCGKTLDKVTWKPYKGDVATGHYYLEEDYVQDGERNVIAGNKVVLDLRGNTITTSGKTRLFLVNGYLAVMDTVGGGVLSAWGNTSDTGGIVQVQENEIPNGAVFELYSGTLTPDANGVHPKSGGLVYLGLGATFRMYDGLLLNGYATGYGGSVCGFESSSVIEILGGSVIGGQAIQSAWTGGGNIYTKGPLTLKNCKVIGGYCNGGGGNIMKTGNTFVMENCLVADGYATGVATKSSGIGGNMYIQTSVTLTVKDSVIRNGYAPVYGGNIYFGAGATRKTFTNTRIFGGTTDGQGANLYNSAGAITTLIDSTIDGGVDYATGTLTLQGTSSIGLTAGKCPCCATAPTWQDYGSTAGNHWKLKADNTSFAGLTVTNGQTVVLDLAGYDLTAAGRAFTVEAGGTLILMDSEDGSVVTASGVNGDSGGVIANSGTVKIYGGKYVYAKNADIAISSGGVIDNSGTLNIYGGIIDGSAYNNTASTSFGGAIYQSNATADALHYFTMSGGLVIGGTAYSGGSVYLGNYGDVTITGGMIRNGTAYKDGGNLFAYGGPYNSNYKVRITDCAILDGTVSNPDAIDGWGGNINTGRYEMTLNNCYISGGTITSGSKNGYGGNIHSGSVGVIKATDTVIINGDSCTAGGNIYTSNGKSDVTLTDCLVAKGVCVTSGGNIRTNNGVLRVEGGMIAYGTAGTTGGNIHSNTTTETGTTLVADAQGNIPRIYNGTAATKGGNLYISGPATVTAAHVRGGVAPAGADLYGDSATNLNLTLGQGLVGDIALGVANGLFASENIYGGGINKITCEATNANFYLDGTFNNCGIQVENKTMYVAVSAVLDGQGNMQWYMSNDNAVAACDADSYVKLFTGNDLALTKDCAVDLNGQTVNVSGAYTLYGMDSSGDDYTEPAGKATLAEGTKLATATDAPNGNTYFAVTTDGDSTFHRLGMKVTGLSVRPSAKGIYYTAKWSCDDTLKAKVTGYGMAVSVAQMPTENFMADTEAAAWTKADLDAFASGVTTNSVIIQNILDENQDADKNDENSKKPIYATAYAIIDGKTYLSDGVEHSLYNVMKSLDDLITKKPETYRRNTLALRSFYEAWKDKGMGGWNLKKIPTPQEDTTFNLLMIGNSHCYYFVEELYALAQAAGIDMRVCNLYYSGCPLSKHYNWWLTGEVQYQFYETYTNGRALVGNMSLECALGQYEWDAISIQEYGIHLSDSVQDHFADVETYREALLPYLKAQFPNAELFWQQTWGYQFNGDNADYDRSDAAKAADLYEQQKAFAELICDTYGYRRVPSGDAWENVRNDSDYNHLCVRLNNESSWGDGYHDGDIGGGQYLNACVWFEILTGQSVLDNTYVPSYKNAAISSDITAKLHVTHQNGYYTLNNDFVAELKAAAHKAVQESGVTVTTGN